MDTTELGRQYRIAVVVCLTLSLIPVVLLGVGWIMADIPLPGGAGSGTAEPILLWMFGVLGFSPLATVPLVRATSRNPSRGSAAQQSSPEATVMVWAVIEYFLWELPSLLAFTGFVAGATWTYFLVFIAITVVGFIVSFPRWSSWVTRLARLSALAASA